MRATAAPDSMRAKWLIVKLPNGWADTSTNRPIVITASNGHRSAPSIIGRRLVDKDIRQPPKSSFVWRCELYRTTQLGETRRYGTGSGSDRAPSKAPSP